MASFYDRFATDRRPPLALHVCDDVACRCAGADELCAALEQSFGPAGPHGAHGGAVWYRDQGASNTDPFRSGRRHLPVPGFPDSARARFSAPLACAGRGPRAPDPQHGRQLRERRRQRIIQRIVLALGVDPGQFHAPIAQEVDVRDAQAGPTKRFHRLERCPVIAASNRSEPA